MTAGTATTVVEIQVLEWEEPPPTGESAGPTPGDGSAQVVASLG